VDESIVDQVVLALSEGFRHLDLAEVYGNEREVKKALEIWQKKAPQKNKREDLWITSKVWHNLPDVVAGCKGTIERLGCQYLDLYLIHAPPAFRASAKGFPGAPAFDGSLESVWKQMEQCHKMGLARNIGVSNFRGSDIVQLMTKVCPTIHPLVNQIEFNPYLQQPELQRICAEHKIVLQAYSPLASLNNFPGGPVDAVVKRLAAKHKQTEAAVLLKYTTQKGVIAITTTRKKERINEYLDAGKAADFLSQEEIAEIDQAGNTEAWAGKRKYWLGDFGETKDIGKL